MEVHVLDLAVVRVIKFLDQFLFRQIAALRIDEVVEGLVTEHFDDEIKGPGLALGRIVLVRRRGPVAAATAPRVRVRAHLERHTDLQ